MTRARDVANLIGSGNYSSTTFTATAGQTAFSISHTQGFVQVFMNGLLLDLTTDYTSNGSAITLTSGAAAGDEIEVVAYNTFSVGDALPKSGGTMSGALTVDAAAATPLTVDRATNDGTVIDVQKDGASVGSIGASGGDLLIHSTASSHGGLRFGEGYVFPVNNSGATSNGGFDLGLSVGRFKDLYLSGGVYLGGTGSANYFEDYEEGTWTPTVGAITGQTQPTVTAGTFSGHYTKIGSVVVASFYIGPFQFNSTGQSSTLAVKGFPFTGDPNKHTTGGPANAFYYITFARSGFVSMRHYTSNEFGFLSSNNGGNWGWEACSAAGTGASRYIIGSMTYFTDQ